MLDLESIACRHFLGDPDSGSQPGWVETSNSGAAEGRAAGFAPGFNATGWLDDEFPASFAPAVPEPETEAAAAFAIAGFGPAVAGLAGAADFAAARGFTAEAVFAFPEVSAALPRPSACSTEAFKSTSMRNGDPEEYSAWNITFQDWQIMRSRKIGSCAENWARRQSIVCTPLSSSSVRPSRMILRSPSMRRKNTRRMR